MPRRHSSTKPVRSFAADIVGLIGALHVRRIRLPGSGRRSNTRADLPLPKERRSIAAWLHRVKRGDDTERPESEMRGFCAWHGLLAVAATAIGERGNSASRAASRILDRARPLVPRALAAQAFYRNPFYECFQHFTRIERQARPRSSRSLHAPRDTRFSMIFVPYQVTHFADLRRQCHTRRSTFPPKGNRRSTHHHHLPSVSKGKSVAALGHRSRRSCLRNRG